MRRRIPHLSVLLRDRVGVVGPLCPARTVELPALRRPPPDHLDRSGRSCAPSWSTGRVAGHAVTGLTVGVALEQPSRSAPVSLRAPTVVPRLWPNPTSSTAQSRSMPGRCVYGTRNGRPIRSADAALTAVVRSSGPGPIQSTILAA